ncbi:MFS transporter, partial [Mycobacterium bohemicum]|uniref:MFS transporter n=1 Tax=Mycobacterium bohemicum TaxID=56425 RepID=UPI0021F3409D
MGSNGATGLAGRTELQARGRDGSNATLFAAVLFLLFAMGWAASHFVALMPAISDSQHMSPAMLDAIFGIYALGLLPGLVVGGRTSDAWGRRPVALTGAAAALVGTLAMVVSEHSFPLLVGRFVVGLGVGLAMSSGTAWASDLRGTPGAATAGAVLIAGFAVGPFIAGAVAGAGRPGVGLSFWIAAGLLVLAMGIAAVTPQDAGASAAAPPGCSCWRWASRRSRRRTRARRPRRATPSTRRTRGTASGGPWGGRCPWRLGFSR